MVARYVIAIRELMKRRDAAQIEADDTDTSTWRRSHHSGQVYAYAQAILTIHDTFNPATPYSAALYAEDERYARACLRVGTDVRLAPYAGLLLYRHRGEEEHWDWVVDAPVEELVSWGESLKTDNLPAQDAAVTG